MLKYWLSGQRTTYDVLKKLQTVHVDFRNWHIACDTYIPDTVIEAVLNLKTPILINLNTLCRLWRYAFRYNILCCSGRCLFLRCGITHGIYTVSASKLCQIVVAIPHQPKTHAAEIPSDGFQFNTNTKWNLYRTKIKQPWGWFNKKISSYQYRKSHCEDKTILRPSYLHNGISYTGKMTSLYWIRAHILG